MTDGHDELQIDVLRTAQIPMPQGYAFRAPGSRLARLRAGLSKRDGVLDSPCLAFVVRHPRAGVILIDTGFHPDATTSPRRDFGPVMSLMFRDLTPAAQSFADQLRTLGVAPEGVTRVLMTHLHVDHTSGMRLLPNATFTCTRREWEAAHGRLAAANGYVGHHLPPASRAERLDLDAEGTPHRGFARTLDLLGDGSIRLISTPGHTRGHMSVLIALGPAREVLVVGDAAYTLRSIREQRLPMLSADDDASRRALEELDAFARANPEVALVPTHDPDAWRQLSTDGAAA